MTIMSREALLEAAWQRPLTDIAAELGVSDVGLRKICDRHDIPTPGRGYWAQVRAGKTFARPKLRPASNPRKDQVHIAGERSLPPVVVDAMKQAKSTTDLKAKARREKTSPAVPEVASQEQGEPERADTLAVAARKDLGADAIHMWSGPDQERHDFVSDRLHIEVKTTIRSRHEHEISRVDQLTTPEGRRLLLASVQLEESVAGADSLATLIDAVLGTIRRDGAALDVFLTALSVLGWTDEMRRSPELIRFNVRDAQIFEVDDEFPALPKGFELPAGVLAIRYTISLANLPVLDSADVAEAIRECRL